MEEELKRKIHEAKKDLDFWEWAYATTGFRTDIMVQLDNAKLRFRALLLIEEHL